MSHPQLDNLVHIGQLKAEPPSEAECQGLLRSGLRRLERAQSGESFRSGLQRRTRAVAGGVALSGVPVGTTPRVHISAGAF